MGERSPQIGKRIGCAAIVAAGALTLGLGVHHDLQFTAEVTTPQWIAEQSAMLRQEECIYHAIRSQVPQGAAVYIGLVPTSLKHAPGPAEQWTLWDETRLTELSTLWVVPKPTPASAQWTLALVHEPGHCAGLALEARRR
jgi:hypothetical protein